MRTIVNLRGGREYGSWPLEREVCERQGPILTEFVVRSREAPSSESCAAPTFDTVQYPVLV